MIRLKKGGYKIYLNEVFEEHLDELIHIIVEIENIPCSVLRDSRSTFAAVFEAFGHKLHIKRTKPRSPGYLIRHLPPRHGRILRNFLTALQLRRLNLPSLIPVAALFRRRLLLLKEAILITLYIEGRPLSEFLDEEVPIRRAGEAVAAFHNASVLHGDLKPSNIIVTPNGRAVICDYDETRILCRGIRPKEVVKDIERMRRALNAERFNIFLVEYIERRDASETEKRRIESLLQEEQT